MAQFVDLSETESFEMADGVVGRPLFGNSTMLNAVELQPGSEVALHSHPHEQLGLILEGDLIFTVDGTDRHLTAGHAFQLQAAFCIRPEPATLAVKPSMSLHRSERTIGTAFLSGPRFGRLRTRFHNEPSSPGCALRCEARTQGAFIST